MKNLFLEKQKSWIFLDCGQYYEASRQTFNDYWDGITGIRGLISRSTKIIPTTAVKQAIKEGRKNLSI